MTRITNFGRKRTFVEAGFHYKDTPANDHPAPAGSPEQCVSGAVVEDDATKKSRKRRRKTREGGSRLSAQNGGSDDAVGHEEKGREPSSVRTKVNGPPRPVAKSASVFFWRVSSAHTQTQFRFLIAQMLALMDGGKNERQNDRQGRRVSPVAKRATLRLIVPSLALTAIHEIKKTWLPTQVQKSLGFATGSCVYSLRILRNIYSLPSGVDQLDTTSHGVKSQWMIQIRFPSRTASYAQAKVT
jgi:hypothetical protein